MKKRREFISPGVVIGLFASLLAYDLYSAEANGWDVLPFCLIGFFAPFIGCWWVGLKHRSEGRDIGRSILVTVAMGAIAGTCVYPIIGTIFGAGLTAVFILPPTLWVAFLSIRGFHRSREGTFARTIWWRRRWHATIAVCAGALVIRLALGRATPYSVGLAAGIALIAALCLISLLSLSHEIERVTKDLRSTLAVHTAAPIDLGVGEDSWVRTVDVGEGAYRAAVVPVPVAVGDLVLLRKMMRHTLGGAIALTTFATSTVGAASLSFLHAHWGR
jgi:hypothetical protein